MYVPKHFAETDPSLLKALIRAHPLGAWVNLGSDELIVNHIPFYFDSDAGEYGTLIGHVARANPVWKVFSDSHPSVVIFQGEQAYISPSWYPSKLEDNRTVPTWNYVVVQAASSETALQMASERSFDAILTDINLPGASGLDVLRVVRGRDRNVPVVLMTGGPEMETARLAVEWGAQSYLIKPLSMPQLKEVLERVIRAYHLARRQRQILDVSERLARESAVLRDQFGRTLDSLWMAFQPIVSWSQKKVVAYEALMRSTDPTLYLPLDILNVAESLGEVHTLGHRTRGLIAEVLQQQPDVPGVFINLHVLDLLDEQLYAPDSPLRPFAPRIHFEITERMAIEKIPDTHDRVERLRALGYKIAVDDLGEGYSGICR